MSLPVNYKTYIGNDQQETIDILTREESPIYTEETDLPTRIFEPKKWNGEQSPLISLNDADMEMLYLMGDCLEVRMMEQIKMNPQSEFNYTCCDCNITDSEKGLFKNIMKYLVACDQFFFTIGWRSVLDEHPILVGGFNPLTKSYYSL